LLTTGCPHLLRPVVVRGGRVVWAAAAGRAASGAGHGRGPQPAVWRVAAMLRRRWPPSPCWGSAPCGLRSFAGGVAGAAAGLCLMPRGRWRTAIGGLPYRLPPRRRVMMILLLFLQKQNLASSIYLFGLGTRLSGPGLKHMR
jgi:hypothetical protein